MSGVKPFDLVGYGAVHALAIARVYWPAEFRQSLLVGRLTTTDRKW